jgi:signal transduction histidine kinase
MEGTGNFNLGLRLTLTFSALVALILGGNALVVWQFHIIRNQTDRLTGANQQLIEILRLQSALLSFHRQLDDLALSMDERRLVTEAESLRQTLHEQTQQTRTALANLPPASAVDPSFLPTLDAIDVTLPSELKAILELGKSGNWAVIHPRLSNELNPIETETAILVNSISQQTSGELARGVAEMTNVQRRIVVIVPATALSTFFIAAFLGWSMARRMIELRLDERVNERTRIARELHDTLLQNVQGLILKISVTAKRIPETDPTRQEFEKTLDYADHVLAEGRDRVRSLRSETVPDGDLSAAFQLVAEESSPNRIATFRTVVEGDVRELNPMIQEESYSVGREAIINALKHSEGHNVEVEIIYESHEFRLRIRDDGRGIDPHLLEMGGRADHWGLQGMRERANNMGAKFDLWSRLESGTEVELTVPAAIAYRTPRGKPADSRYRASASKEKL